MRIGLMFVLWWSKKVRVPRLVQMQKGRPRHGSDMELTHRNIIPPTDKQVLLEAMQTELFEPFGCSYDYYQAARSDSHGQQKQPAPAVTRVSMTV